MLLPSGRKPLVAPVPCFHFAGSLQICLSGGLTGISRGRNEMLTCLVEARAVPHLRGLQGVGWVLAFPLPVPR